MQSMPKDELMRVAGCEGRLTADPEGKAPGRGVYVCKNRECMEKALRKGGFQRSLRRNSSMDEISSVIEELQWQLQDEQ